MVENLLLPSMARHPGGGDDADLRQPTYAVELVGNVTGAFRLRWVPNEGSPEKTCAWGCGKAGGGQ